METSERSGEVSKIAAGRTEPDKVLSRPNPEVPAKATRRRFSARYKLRVLEQTDGCESGEVGALLRREGLYWSNLQTWRRQREQGTLQALTPRKRGRKAKPVNPLDRQLRQVEAENRKLKRKLEKFEAMLDLQKKSRNCWESLWRAAKRTETRADGRSFAILTSHGVRAGCQALGSAAIESVSGETSARTAGAGSSASGRIPTRLEPARKGSRCGGPCTADSYR